MSKRNDEKILIVGAGPVGLSAALFLVANGYKCRLVEKSLHKHDTSRAINITCRTLRLFEEIDVANVFLANGHKIFGINFHLNGKFMGKNHFENMKSAKYQFILMLPQVKCENILEEKLRSKEILVERGVELSDIIVDKNQVVKVVLLHSDISQETSYFSLVLACDGAHSQIRKKLNVSFKGSTIDRSFKVYDYRLQTQLHSNEAHIYLNNTSSVFLFPICNDLWRVGGRNYEEFQHGNHNLFKVKEKSWESEFMVHHRVVEKFDYKRKVFFAGDAAHLNSPVGGRGMNLGIEDAYTFVKLLKDNRLDEYNEKRLAIVNPLVKRIRKITLFIAGESIFYRIFKNFLAILLPIVFKFIENHINRFFLGLDYDLNLEIN